MTEKQLATITTLPTYSPAQMQLIRQTVARDCNREEFDLFMEICRQTGLDPFKKHIYAFVFKKTRKKKIGGQWTEIEERTLTPVTGIDGYRSIAQRSGTFRPADTEPQFVQDESAICEKTNPEGIIKCLTTVYIWGQDKQYHPVVGSARWKEYAPIVDDGDWQNYKFVPNGKKHLDPKKPNWKKMPFIMLAKCAEAQALRKGWEMGGVYEFSEMDAADTEKTASEELEAYEQEQRMGRVTGKDSISIMLDITGGLQNIEVGQFYDKINEHIQGIESAQDLDFWRKNQAAALQIFWGKKPDEAMALKKAIEQKIAQLAAIPKDAVDAQTEEAPNDQRNTN